MDLKFFSGFAHITHYYFYYVQIHQQAEYCLLFPTAWYLEGMVTVGFNRCEMNFKITWQIIIFNHVDKSHIYIKVRKLSKTV